MTKPKVVILGGGFAGIECAKAFHRKPVDVLVIDRQNHHLFQQLLYQVASAGLAAPEIAHPIRSVIYRHGFSRSTTKSCRTTRGEASKRWVSRFD